jgi:hypothetical protein
MNRTDEAMAEAARSAIDGFLDAPENAALLRHIQSTLGISKPEIRQGCLHYTLGSFDSGNDIYESAATHIAMWIEYRAAGGIHARRQGAVLRGLQRRQPRALADIGFGAPTQYLRDYVLPSPGVRVELLDKYPAAIEVGRSILAYWGVTPLRDVAFAVHDMDVDAPPQGRDCYLMLDAIEHAAEPGRYLRATVAAALHDALFLFHLPIGPQIPSHSIAWAGDADAVAWLAAAGLEVERTEVIVPNPQVDIFAQHEVKMTNLFVVAHKR